MEMIGGSIGSKLSVINILQLDRLGLCPASKWASRLLPRLGSAVITLLIERFRFALQRFLNYLLVIIIETEARELRNIPAFKT